jgi:hypothetical protein
MALGFRKTEIVVKNTRWINRQTDSRQTDRQTVRQTVDRQTDSRQTDRRMDGRTDGWMDGWIEGQTDRHTDRQYHCKGVYTKVKIIYSKMDYIYEFHTFQYILPLMPDCVCGEMFEFSKVPLTIYTSNIITQLIITYLKSTQYNKM